MNRANNSYIAILCNIFFTASHPDQTKYPKQKMAIVEIDGYACLVPYVDDEEGVFLKTIIPSRKATKKYLRGQK